jgi:hypothetical protein
MLLEVLSFFLEVRGRLDDVREVSGRRDGVVGRGSRGLSGGVRGGLVRAYQVTVFACPRCGEDTVVNVLGGNGWMPVYVVPRPGAKCKGCVEFESRTSRVDVPDGAMFCWGEL